MKNQILLLLLCFGFLVGFSQEKDTFQSDSLYRVNKVKLRKLIHAGADTKQTNIIRYDKNGRMAEYILSNAPGLNALFKIVYKYDPSGKLIAEDYFYGSMAGEKTKIDYDTAKRVLKKSTSYYDNKPKSEIQFSYEPLVEFQKKFNREGILQREQYSYYERSNVTNRFRGTDYRPNGQKDKTWEYTFTNTFDSAGRLVKRESKQGTQSIQFMEYEYNDKGLLIRKTIRSEFSPPVIEEYKYEYWE